MGHLHALETYPDRAGADEDDFVPLLAEVDDGLDERGER